MTEIKRYGYGVLASFALIASVLTGCGPKTTETPAASQQAKTSVAPTQKAVKPLPAEATMKLDELQPAIEKPVNPADADKLGDRTKEIVPKAEKALADKDYTSARTLLDRAAGFEPNNRRIRRGLGLAYFGLHNPGRAMQNLARAVEIAPDDLEAQFLLGKLYSANKQTAEAITALRTATKCTGFAGEKPEAAEVMLLLGRALQSRKKWRASLDCYEQLEEWLGLHGQVYRDTPELAKLLLEPEKMLTRRGVLLQLLREPAAAAKLLERAYSRNRTHEPTVRALFIALVNSGKYSNAEKLLVDIAGNQQLRILLPVTSQILCKASGDKTMPRRIWEICVEKNQADQSLAVVLADSARKLGAEKESYDLLTTVLKSKPGSLVVTQYLADMYIAQQHYGKALAILADMVHVDPSLAGSVSHNTGNMLLAGMSGETIAAFRETAAADNSEKACAIHYIAGVIAHQQGDRETAIVDGNKAIELDGKFYPAYRLLMAVYLSQGEKDKADDVIKRLKDAGDDEFYVYAAEGRLAFHQKRYDDALKAFKKAQKKNPDDVSIIINLAMAHNLKKQNREAENLLKKAIRLAPDNPAAYIRLFEHYLVRRAITQARTVAHTLSNRNPFGVEAGIMMVKLNIISRRRDHAVLNIEALKKQSPHNVEVKLLDIEIRLLWADKGKLPDEDFKEIVDILLDIASRLPNRYEAKRKLAKVLIRQGDHKQAAEVWAKLYAESTDKTQVGKSYVAALLHLKRHEDAVKVLEELLANEPGDVRLQAALFDSLVAIKQNDKAVEYAEIWMKEATDPKVERHFSGKLMDLYKAGKQYDKIQILLDKQIERATSEKISNHLKIMKLAVYNEAKQYDEAIEFVKKWTKDSPENTDSKQFLINMLDKAKQYDKALAMIDEWLAAARKDPDAKELAEKLGFWKAYMYIGAEQYDAAAKYLTEWIAEAPVDIRKKVLLIDVLGESEKYDEALKLLDEWMAWATAELAKADEETPTVDQNQKTTLKQRKAHADELLLWCRSRAIGMLMMMDKHEDALKRADKYIALQEDDQVDLMSIKSSVLGELGRDKDALAVLEKALELDPEDVSLNNNLGYMYADMGIELAKAERMIRKALAEIKAPHILDSLGWVLYKQGRFDAAARVFEQIFAKVGKGGEFGAVILDHAADNYYRMGKKDKAVELWSKALDEARKDKKPGRDVKLALKSLPGKIQAVEQKTEPELAPLGKDVKQKDKTESSTEK